MALRFALTGAGGFLGGHVLDQAIERNWHVVALFHCPRVVGRTDFHALQGDVADPAIWDLLLPGCDAVIHLAAAGVNDLNNAAECVRVNTLPIVHLFEAAKRHGVRRVVIAGSCFEYGATGDAIGERGLREDDPLRPQNAYAGAKAAATMLAQSLAVETGIETLILRPFHTYGPGEPAHRLIPDVIRMARSGEPIRTTEATVWRDLVHVSDVARAFLDAAIAPWQGSPNVAIVNIGTGIRTRLRDVIQLLASGSGRSVDDIQFGAKTYRSNEVRSLVASVEAAAALLTWQPRISEAEGLQRMLRESEAAT